MEAPVNPINTMMKIPSKIFLSFDKLLLDILEFKRLFNLYPEVS